MRQRLAVRLTFVLGGIAVVLVLAAVGWRPFETISQKLRHETPHERYARSLVESQLAQTALAAEWLEAANRGVQQPITLQLPFAEAALVDPARPAALGYAITLKRGQRLDVQVTVATDRPGQVFVDLFGPPRDREPRRRLVASARDNETTLSYEANESGTYVLRVQPELLRGGHVRVTSTPLASLRFPVSGADARTIKSVYGDARDAGRRRHEGVDIFAPRGTPVLAAADGLVFNVGENTLGGRVVWLWDTARGLRLYYAHLEEQRVRTGTFVRAGDALGTVGNTGNARSTAPHLHFGIYARGEGAIDPDGFVRPPATPSAETLLGTSLLGKWARTRGPASLRASPAGTAPVLEVLPRAAAVRVEGTLGGWVRTSTDTQPAAFVEARELAISRAEPEH